jgi:predicted aldo/keto reductase-like oxidoreductase
MNETNRRRFLRAAVASVAAAGLGSRVLAEQQDDPAGIPTRPLGKTGERVSIVGIGGYHIGTANEKEAIAIMHEAIDEGMTFFDNSWDYNGGRSEETMGKALAQGGYRDKVFLMTKVCARDYDGAKEQLEASLTRLQTDVIDLWQFHEINWDVDPDWIYEQGALKFALESQKAGKVRHIGFTGHKDPAYHLKMLSKPYEWATVQMPINILDAHYRSFQKKVVPECTKRDIGVIGMKALSNGVIPDELGITAEMCRRFSLSLPISTLACGIRSRENLRQDLAMARGFKPVTQEEIDELLAKTAEPGRDGRLEHYKTTRYGSAYHFRQHGE